MPTDRAVDFLSLKRFQEEIPLCRSDKEAAKEKLKNIQVSPIRSQVVDFNFNQPSEVENFFSPLSVMNKQSKLTGFIFLTKHVFKLNLYDLG